MATWTEFLDSERSKNYFRELQEFIQGERKSYGRLVTPSSHLELEAFRYGGPDHVKAIILGKDPNPFPPKATGLAFSLPRNRPVEEWDRSIRTIIRALELDDVSFNPTGYGCFENWTNEGVLLLNSILTYRRDEKTRTNAHEEAGWETFTKHVIEFLSANYKNLVFLFLGEKAQEFIRFVNNRFNHLVLEGPHPAACGYDRPELEEEFIDCKFFSTTNKYLARHGKTPVNWQI